MASTAFDRWPAIPVAAWQDTRDTLHLYTQVIGKVRLANEPFANPLVERDAVPDSLLTEP